MKRLILAALSACAIMPAAAQAEVSQDLRFCSSLGSSKERLACYDAAVRIGRTPVSRRLVVAPPADPIVTVGVSPSTQQTRRSFDGAYVGVTGGYDIAAPNQPLPTSYTSQYFTYKPGAFDNINGGKIGGVAGYNVTSGALLIGFEARAQYAFGSDATTSSYHSGEIGIPYNMGYCYGCTPGSYQSSYPITLISSQQYEQRYSRPFGGDLSLRAGIVIDQWLLFGRAGVGVEMSRISTTDDRSGDRTCNNPIRTASLSAAFPGRVDFNITGCSSITSGTITHTAVERISPTVTLAAGVERNFGDMFVRAEAELMLHFPVLSSQVYYSPAANVVVGYRF